MQNKSRILKVLLIILLSNSSLNAQIGGNNTYEFLNLITSPRIAGLGGSGISIYDDDINLVIQNPSLLTSAMHNHLTLNYINYFTDVNYGYSAYSRASKKFGNFYGGILFAHYGKFIEADETGQKLGNFYAGENALIVGYSRNLLYSTNHPVISPDVDTLFAFGTQLKIISSSLYTYNSFGLALDAGVTYRSRNRLVVASLVAKNIGKQIKSYRPDNKEPLPFEVQMGFSTKFKYAPIRLLFTAHHLETPDISFINLNSPETSIDPETGEEIIEPIKLYDKILRHFIVGAELLPTKSLNFYFGFNYQRRQELKLSTKMATAGFSWGIGIKLSKFNISYARATYHLAGASNHFSVTTNLPTAHPQQSPTTGK